ncbi:hypothetical protein [Natrinema halophilum]|uniref:Uncharacterized protein n=1 Tax=Natrinema halophilum TaxID=1699371 RepID=A0A7D5GRA2_9EURY|nr:hypothetical protein [Natrinema halophilum]QLG48449.1 MSCRAMM family adhesin SdrC [Natrinema halophilum]
MDDSTIDAESDTDAEPEAESQPDTDAEPEAESQPDTDAEWMEPADRPILELLESDEDIFEPNQIDDEGICPANYAAYRCREMTKYGLLEKLMPGFYEVSDLGERYLAGDLDPSELEPDG